MSSGSGASPVPAGRDPNQDDGDSRAEKGDNHGENQSVPRRPGSASGNQASTNQQQSPRQAEGHQKKFTHGSSGQNVEDKEEAMDSCTNRTGGAQGRPVTTAMTSAEDSPRTQGKKNACRDFHNIDYSGHFKINLVNNDHGITKSTKVLKMEIGEEQFVKFCHLFLCDLQLGVVKEALQTELKLDVLKGGYPPSVYKQPGASEPVDTSVKRILTSLCFQLKAFNILSTSWDIEKVKTTLSSIESYQNGNLIGYEVSDDSLNYWLVGEQGAMQSAMDVLGRELGPRSNLVQQSPKQQDRASKEFDTANFGNERGQQNRAGQTDHRLQQTGPDVSGQKQQQETEQATKKTLCEQQNKELGNTNQEYQSVEEQTSAEFLKGKQAGNGPGDGNCDPTEPSMREQQQGTGSPTGPSMGGQQGGTGGCPTGPSMGGQQGGTGGDPTRPSMGGQQGGTGGCPTGPSRGGQQEGTGGCPTGHSMRGKQEGTGGCPTGPSRGGQQEGTGGCPTGPSMGGQQGGTGGGPTRPSVGGQQGGTGGCFTGPSMGGQQGGTGNPTGPSMANLDTRKSVRSEEKELGRGDIPFADEDSDHGSSLTETQKGYKQLSEWSGQNTNNPPRGSTTAPGDQNIDRYQGQGQNGKHEGPVGVQTGGHNTGVQNMMEPGSTGTGDQNILPKGQFPSTKVETGTPVITCKVNLGRCEENILSCLPVLLEDLRYKFPDVEIGWEKGRRTVSVTGAEVDVSRVKTGIENQLKTVKKNKVEIDSKLMKQEALNMFREKTVYEYLREKISQKVACYLAYHEDTIGVYLRLYAADTDIGRAVELVTASVVCREIEMDSDWKLFLDSPYVQQELSDLQKEHNGRVVITTQDSLVTLSCTADIEHAVLTVVDKMKEDFFKESKKTVRYKADEHMTVELCTRLLQHDIQLIEEKYGVRCQPIENNGKQGWKVEGPYGTLEKSCRILKELSATVTSKHLPLMDKVTEDFFKTKPGQDDMDRVGENTGCLVTLEKQEDAASQGTLGAESSTKEGLVSSTEQSDGSNLAGRQWKSEDGRVVALYCGDGRMSTSDVLVELAQNKDSRPVRFNPIGDKVTAVTMNLPEWMDGNKKEKDTVRKTFQNILLAATEKGYTSLTVLLDDCERCGWKGNKACKLLVKNTLYVFQTENVQVCSCTYYVRDQDMFIVLRDVIHESFSGVAQISVTDEKEEIPQGWEVIQNAEVREKKPEIKLQQGELAKMQCHVIVNTTDKSLKLVNGAVSYSILKEAGPDIQKDCDQNYANGVRAGDVAVTKGYKLKCDYVFHGALPSYDHRHDMKKMESFLWLCLSEADVRNCTTISFPALGTGNLGYPRDRVAKVMFETVNKYLQENKGSSIECVYFVVYPKDKPTVKAFEEQQRFHDQRVQTASAHVPTLPMSEQIGLQYGAIDLWVTYGQIDKANYADGLLIFWDSTTLYKTSLSCSYFNENCNLDGVNSLRSQRTNLSKKGMPVVTGAGSLHFDVVIHCLIKEDKIDLQTVMSVLTEADSQRLSSVVLYLSTKEPLTRFKLRFVNQFHDALKQFSGSNKTLKRVEIMFDSKQVYMDTEYHIRSLWPDKLVENKTVTGASGGVQTRSMTREASAKQSSDENVSKRIHRTHLLVASKSEDSIEKAIQQLKLKISDIQTQHQGQLTSSSTPASTDPKPPPRKRKTEKDIKQAQMDDGAQHDQNSSPVNESTILERTEHEDRRLVLKSTRPSTLEKSRVEVWLKGNGVENFTVICPFLQDTEALIIFLSVNDAEKLLKKTSHQYTVKKFPPQTVQNLKATLKTAMVETIKECIEPGKIKDEMYRASGAEWFEENGTCFLKGSLPEIQCAYRFIIRRTAGRNVRQDNQQRSHTDGEGAAQGGIKGSDAPDSQGNEQDKNTEPNTSYSKVDDSSSDITKRNDGQKSHSYSQYPQDTLVEENERQGAKGHSKSKSLQQNEPPDITTVPSRPISQGQEVSRLNPTQQLTGMNTVIDGKQNSGNGNKILASSESDLRSEEEEKRLKHVNQLGKSIDMKDENDFDNSLHFMKENDKEGSACQRTQPDNQSFPVKEEIVKCSAETFSEICFFNEGITNKVKVQFTDDRSECCVTDRNGVFKKAKDCLSAYARKEIYNLKKNEQSKFQHYYKQAMEDGNFMKIFCFYNHKTNSVQLVGQNYDMIEAAEQSMLTAIGRGKGTSHGHSVQHSIKGSVHMKKRPPAGSVILQTRQGLRMFVYQEDLLHLDVDAIIHGTNGSLDNSGDLGSTIAIAAGPDLERECYNTFLKRGKLNLGECCITTAGNLHYQFIIHAVIMDRTSTKPHKQQSKQLCQNLLCRSILNSLLEAEKSGARSVALPAIGRRLLSPEICTAAYKESVDLFCKQRKHSNVVEIHFVDQDKDILKKVGEVFQASKPQITRPVAPAMQRVIRTVVYPLWMAKSDTGGTLRLNDKLTLCVMKQCFVDTHASALVSVEDEEFQSRRYVAREIEKKAGGRYRQEKENLKKGKKRPNISDVFHTRAGDMQNVSNVLHVIAPVPDSKTSQDMALWKGLTDSIRACYYQVFKKIDELKMDSIALPSLAMGTLKDGQTEELWQICVEEVVKYTKHPKPKSRLNRIILADPSAKTTSFLIGLLDSMLPSLAMSESTV